MLFQNLEKLEWSSIKARTKKLAAFGEKRKDIGCEIGCAKEIAKFTRNKTLKSSEDFSDKRSW